ncbi:glycosyltransferase family 2 protein [Candidatus Uhrbacteria bacterium]|nr:glycosyltransferase family 2 protein [Candidatus Uhrbacteria bacterium]
MSKVVAVIPAFNEQATIQEVIRSVRPMVQEIIVINDGSLDATSAIARAEGVVVIDHRLNCGLGAALSTGLHVARRRGADFVVTLDADGQMFAEDIARICAPLEEGRCDLVIGSRFLEGGNAIPKRRRLYNRIGNILTWALFGIQTSDSQSGIRGFNAHAMDSIGLRCSRMEVSSEFFLEIQRRNIRWQEVPVRIQYTAYSLSKGQNFFHGVRTLARLAMRR